MTSKGTYSLLVAFSVLVIISTSFIYLDTEIDKIHQNKTQKTIAELRPYWSNVRILMDDAAADAVMDWKWDDVESTGTCDSDLLPNIDIRTKMVAIYTEIFDYLKEKDGISCSVNSADNSTSGNNNEIYTTLNLKCEKNTGEGIISYERELESRMKVSVVLNPVPVNRCEITVEDLITGAIFMEAVDMP